MNDDAKVLPSPRDRLEIGSDAEALAIAGWLKAKTSHDKIYFAPAIPAQKLVAARQACQLPESEQLLALVDFTVFGSAAECLVVGWSAVHYRWPSAASPCKVDFAKFLESEITSSWGVVSIGKDNKFAPGPSVLPDVVQLLQGLQVVLVKGVPIPTDGANATATAATANGRAPVAIPRFALFIILGLIFYFARDVLSGEENILFLLVVLLAAVGLVMLLVDKSRRPKANWRIGELSFDWRNALLVLIPGIAWTAYSPGGRAEPSYMLSLVAGLAVLFSFKKYKG